MRRFSGGRALSDKSDRSDESEEEYPRGGPRLGFSPIDTPLNATQPFSDA